MTSYGNPSRKGKGTECKEACEPSFTIKPANRMKERDAKRGREGKARKEK